MFKRFISYFLCVLLVLIDVSVVPVFTASVFVVPLALVYTMCIGLALGRLHGLLTGLLGGLLVDIFVGTPLGYMMCVYMACGFLEGLLAHTGEELMENYSSKRAFLKRIFVTALLMTLFEAVTMIYQYFNTAFFSVKFIWYALYRVGIMTVLVNALFWPIDIYHNGAARRVRFGAKKEARKL